MAKYLLRFRDEEGVQTGRMELEGPVFVEAEVLEGKVKAGEIRISGKPTCAAGFKVAAKRAVKKG